MKLGSNDISSVKIGSTDVNKIYIGSTEVWSAANPLLDDYPGAAAAYSLRLLSSTYSGDSIRVRRASDNAESDIGFVSGQLDTSTLETFCSGTDGFVTTWYDQSGNGYNATQSTSANQPQIVSSGSVILENGKPSVQFTSSSSQVLIYNGLVYTTNTVFGTSVIRQSSTPAFSVIFTQNSGGQVGRSNLISVDNSSPVKSQFFFNNGTSYSNLSSIPVPNNVQTLLTNYAFDDDYYNAIDGGTANNNISNQSFTPVSSSGSAIGGQPVYANFFNGKIQEIVIWDSNQSSNRSGIESNINNFYNIY